MAMMDLSLISLVYNILVTRVIRGWRESTVWRVLVLHAGNTDSIAYTTYGSLTIIISNS